MGIITSRGIILRKVLFSNTSLIFTALTKDRGRVSLIAKGARANNTTKTAVAPETDVLSICDLTYYEKDAGLLSLLSKSTVQDRVLGVRRNTASWLAGYIVAEIAYYASVDKMADEDLYDITVKALKHIETADDCRQALLWYMCQVLNINGVAPNMVTCAVTSKPLAEQATFCWAAEDRYGYVHGKEPYGVDIEYVHGEVADIYQKILVASSVESVPSIVEAHYRSLGELLKDQVCIFIDRELKSPRYFNWSASISDKPEFSDA